MKKIKTMSCLLFFLFFSFFLISCTDASDLYKKGAYTKVLDYLNRKQEQNISLSKDELYYKIMSLKALDKDTELKDTVISYLFLSDESDNREVPVELFLDYNVSDMIKILCLYPSDGVSAQIELFKSYFNLHYYDNSKILLTEYLHNYLSINDYVRILIKYPFDNFYTLDFLNSWFNIITEDECENYVELLKAFYSLPLETEVRRKTDLLLVRIKNSPYNFMLEGVEFNY